MVHSDRAMWGKGERRREGWKEGGKERREGERQYG
jgi:hypothetical protein